MPSAAIDASPDEQHRSKLRRLRLLQILSRHAPLPLGERALLNHLLGDHELSPTLERIRDSLRYLADNGLVQLVQVDHLAWMAAYINDDGQLWLDSPDDFGLDIYSPDYTPPALPEHYQGRTSSIETLPAETRAWIEQELISRNFTRYSELTDLLHEQGLEISRSAVGRYAKRLKQRVANYKEKAEMVKSLAGVFEEDAASIMQGAMGTAVTAVLDAIEGGEYESKNDSLSGLVKALPSLGKGLRDAEQHKIEQAARRKAIAEVRDELGKAAQSGPLSAEDLQAKIREVYGV